MNEICTYFKGSLRIKLPILWELMINSIKDKIDDTFILRLHNNLIDEDETNKLMISLQLIEVVIPHLDESLHNDIFELLSDLCKLLQHPLKQVNTIYTRDDQE